MAATFGTSGGGFSASPAKRPQAMQELLRMDPRPAWWYTHHPARWTFKDGEWVPWLSQMFADPGVSGVDKMGNTDQAEVTKRRRGFTIIPWDAEPGGYVVTYEGVAGPVHLSKWETPKVVAGQHRLASDEAGYWAFCKRLVADGIIELPDPDFLDVQIERQEKKVTEWKDKAPASPYHRDALAVEEALLEAMKAAKERLYNPPTDGDEPAPAPKPRRGRA